jgi:chemotaxis protein CheZ
MGSRGYSDQDFQEQLQELLAAARGMAEGNFYRMVNIKARGAIGDLAAYINQTLRNLQHLDPTVKGSSREIPKVAKHLAEIIRTTEEATNRVLEQAEHLLEEQAKVEQGLCRVSARLRHASSGPLLQESLRGLKEIQEVQSRSHGRAMEIMAAMEFQDLTTQKIQRLIGLVAEVEERLLRLLVLFRIEEASEPGSPPDPIVESCTKRESALCDQALVDQLLQEFEVAAS